MKFNIIVFDPDKHQEICTIINSEAFKECTVKIVSSKQELNSCIFEPQRYDAFILVIKSANENVSFIEPIKRFNPTLPIIAILPFENKMLIEPFVKMGLDDIVFFNELEQLASRIEFSVLKKSHRTSEIDLLIKNFHSNYQSFIFLDDQFIIQGFNQEAKEYTKRLINVELECGLDGLMLTEGHQKIKAYLISALTGKPSLLETSIKTANGGKLWFAINFMPIHNEEGDVKWICINSLDITHQKLAEHAVRKAEEANKTYFNNNLVGLYQSTIDGELIYANNKLASLLGYSTAKDLMNSPRQYPRDYYNTAQRWEDMLQSLHKRGSLTEFVSQFNDKENQKLWFSEFIRGLYDKKGMLVGFEGTVIDITHYKKTKQKLKETKELVYNIYKHINFGICLVDHNGTIFETNPALSKMCGYSVPDLVGRPISLFFKEKKNNFGSNKNNFYKKKHRTYEQKLLHKNGNELDVLVSDSLVENDQENYQRIISFSNITELKRIQEELYHSKERFKSIISNLPVIIITTDTEGIYTFVEGKGLTDAGVLPNALLGKSAFKLFKEHKSFIRTLKRVLSGETIHGCFDMYDRNYESTSSPIFDIDGNITGSLSVSFDITNRKKIEEEKEKLQSQLFQSQKLEAIGTLSGGIAHEFNNLLAIILGNASLLSRLISNHQKSENYLSKIISAGNRASTLTKKLLTFSRQTDTKFYPLDINTSIDSVIELLEHTVDKRIHITKSLQQNLPMIMGDKNQLEQVILNLAVNAIDAISSKREQFEYGECQFRTQLITPDSSFKKIYQIDSDSPMVLLEIADSGVGIPDDLREKVFEPFFTTKGLGKGTGLGLSIVYGIITTHKGFIDIQSVPNEGTVFSIYLPVVDEKSQQE